MEELMYASATALAHAIRDKQVSSQEVIEAFLKRIEAVNPQLNAVVQLTADEALAQARQADAALARKEITGPLHGVPMTIKDQFDSPLLLHLRHESGPWACPYDGCLSACCWSGRFALACWHIGQVRGRSGLDAAPLFRSRLVRYGGRIHAAE